MPENNFLQSQSESCLNLTEFCFPQGQSSLRKLTYDLFMTYGPRWKLIETRIDHHGFISLQNPKNVIYNGLRKACSILAKRVCKRRRPIKKETVLAMMEVVHQLEDFAFLKGMKVNRDCHFFRFKQNLLKLALQQDQLSIIQIDNLAQSIRWINAKIKSLGVFKTRNRKSWKITEKAILLIQQFDPFVLRNYKAEVCDSIKSQNPVDLLQIGSSLFPDENSFRLDEALQTSREIPQELQSQQVKERAEQNQLEQL